MPPWREFSAEGKIENTTQLEEQQPSSSPYLSTTLAGLILSITMTCLFRCVLVASVIPKAEPGVFAISTSKGPEALATVSVKQEEQQHV